jgi:site-specific DNA recombinase
MKRTAIYARVSTDDQADKGYSLPSQLDSCRDYADRLGYTVTVEFREDVSGATPIIERLQGSRLSEMVRRREVDAVIVHQVDRLSRDIVDLLATVRSWLRAGVEIYAGDVGKIESELDIVLVIKGWQGSDERKKIRERSMRGKRAKASTGRVIGSRSPYGYQHTRDHNGKIVNFEPIDSQAQIVRLIYDWYVIGDETGKRLSAGAIARKLSAMGVPTPGELNPGYHRKRETGMWQTCTVLSIIANEVYAGVWRFGVRIGDSRNTRPPEEHIPVAVPAIVDRGLWEAAQAQRKHNKQFSRRNAKHDYLLSGLIRCGCGSALCGEYFSNHRYYTCSWRNSHHTAIEERTCKARSVRAQAIEADVWDSIVGIFSDTPRLERLLRVAQQEELAALDPKREELSTVEAMITDAEREAVEIGQALKRASGIVGKALERDMENINRRYEALGKRREVLQAEIGAVRLTEAAIYEALEFAQDVRIGIENADFETKRRNLETLQVEVTVKDGWYYVKSLAGEWKGEIRKLPKAGSKVGIVDGSYWLTPTLRQQCRSAEFLLLPAQPLPCVSRGC